MEDVKVVILDETSPVSQAGFGLPLVFDPNNEQEYIEVSGTDELTGYTSNDPTYQMVQAIFSQSPNPATVAVYGADVSTTSVADELDSLKIEYDDFYFLLLADRVNDNIASAGGWATANGKLFVAQPDVGATVSEIKSLAEQLNSENVVFVAHDGGTSGDDPYSDGAITGRIAPIQPGGTTWKFKALNGVPVATYANADVSQMQDSNVNTIVRKGGIVQTSEGLTTNGGFADITRAKAWLKARIKEEVQRLLYNSEKIPYDDGGIAQITVSLVGILKLAVARGVIALDEDGEGMWTVDSPRRVDIPKNSIANRVLPDINFEATIAGAIHNVEIQGVLQV